MKKRTAMLLTSILLISTLSICLPIQIASAELGQTTVTKHPTDDTYINHGEPDANYGSVKKLIIRNDYGYAGSLGWGWDALIKFDISILTPGSTVLSAKLKTCYNDQYYYNNTNQSLNLYRITSQWNEETATWDNQPSCSSQKTSTALAPVDINVWLEWNVTSDVQSYFSGTYTNYGWKIADENQWEHFDIPEFIFKSKESNEIDKWPILEIELVNEKPETDFNYNISTYERKVEFTDISTDSHNEIESWKWDFGDGSTSYQQNPTHIYEKCGIYSVNLTVTDTVGIANYSLKNITLPIEERVKIEIEKQFNITLTKDFYVNGLNEFIDPNNILHTIRTINREDQISFIISINNSMDKLFIWDTSEDNITKITYFLGSITGFINDSNNSYYIVKISVNSSNPKYVKITDYFANISILNIKREDDSYVPEEWFFRENNSIYLFDTIGSEYELIYGNNPNENINLVESSNENNSLIHALILISVGILLCSLCFFELGHKRRKAISFYVNKGNSKINELDHLIEKVKK